MIMEENKEILQLLQKIEKANRRQTLMFTVLCVCAVLTALCCIVTFTSVNKVILQFNDVMPQITESISGISQAIPDINNVIGQMQTVLTNLESTTEQLATMDLGSMVTDVDELVVTAQQSLDQTMTKLNGIDFAALNKAIKDLAAVIEPLAKISSVFR